MSVLDVFGDQPLFANTDMARRWHLLGFVVQRPSDSQEPIFVETQRGDLSKDAQQQPHIVRSSSTQAEREPDDLNKNTLLSRTKSKLSHSITFPKPEPGNHPIRTVKSLQEHLQTAMAVELSTIPLYLFGMYTVKTPAAYVNDPRYYNPITGAIRGTLAHKYLSASRPNTLPASQELLQKRCFISVSLEIFSVQLVARQSSMTLTSSHSTRC
jgi:hypothetical protein